jgi:hypothetical protein
MKVAEFGLVTGKPQVPAPAEEGGTMLRSAIIR